MGKSNNMCKLSGAQYNRHCEHCMTRLIISARSPDRRTSRRVQEGLFQYMGEDMATRVKKLLTQKKISV